MKFAIWFCVLLIAVVSISSGDHNSCDDDFDFLCGSKECISLFDVCDGTAHCIDASDETSSICSDSCPPYEFQCKYGACIAMEKKCDGIIDCIDVSDESDCIVEHDPEKGIIDCTDESDESDCIGDHGPKEKPKTYSTPKIKHIDITEKGCQIGHLPNIFVTSLTNIGKTFYFGSYAHNYESIEYQCNDGSVPFGERVNHCVNGEWIRDQPICANANEMSKSIEMFKTELPNTGSGQIQKHSLSIVNHFIKTEDNSAEVWNNWVVYYQNQENQKIQSGQSDGELDAIWSFFDMIAYIKNTFVYKSDCRQSNGTTENQHNDKDLLYLLSIIPDFNELDKFDRNELKKQINDILNHLELDDDSDKVE